METLDTSMLSSLLSDPDALKNAISAISGILGSTPASAPAAPPSAPASPDPSIELLEKALPALSTVVQNGKSAVSSEKRTLLNALKPFVAEHIAGQFDHAVRLVSMARMAQSALGQLVHTESLVDLSKQEQPI